MRTAKDRSVERLIPNDAAEYLEPHGIRYASPLVMPDGSKIDLNEPGVFATKTPRKRPRRAPKRAPAAPTR